MKIANPWLRCATALLTGQALATPLDGVYSGTTSQGLPIEFTVSSGGTEVSSTSITITFACPFGAFTTGLGTNPQATITDDAFLWRFGITPGVGIIPGVDNVIIVNATFAPDDTLSGSLNWVRSVFLGNGVQTGVCQALGQSFTAALIGPASAGTDIQPGTVIHTQRVELN